MSELTYTRVDFDRDAEGTTLTALPEQAKAYLTNTIARRLERKERSHQKQLAAQQKEHDAVMLQLEATKASLMARGNSVTPSPVPGAGSADTRAERDLQRRVQADWNRSGY